MTVTDAWFQGRLTELTEDECLELLATRQVGRLAYCDQDGPLAVPVNYVIHNGMVLFRTSPHTSLGQHAPGAAVAFEVDEIDDFTQSGWSVLVRGPAEYVDPDDLPATAESRPTPWAQGVRTLHVRIRPLSITGRRLLSG
jgi:nitroimidazol reductase NimA-like FMN-containing flavoprotein (pyridoxamine 5'-phosphate oxidase superfamily)